MNYTKSHMMRAIKFGFKIYQKNYNEKTGQSSISLEEENNFLKIIEQEEFEIKKVELILENKISMLTLAKSSHLFKETFTFFRESFDKLIELNHLLRFTKNVTYIAEMLNRLTLDIKNHCDKNENKEEIELLQKYFYF